MFLYLVSEKKSVIVNSDKIKSIHEHDGKIFIKLGNDFVEFECRNIDFMEEFTSLNFDVPVAHFHVSDVKTGRDY